MRRWSSTLLILALIASSLLKFASPYHDTWLPSSSLYYSAAVVEAFAAILCLVGRRAIAAGIVIVMSLGGAALAMLWPGSACGCLGDIIELSRTEHLLLAGAFGFLASVVLAGDSRGNSVPVKLPEA